MDLLNSINLNLLNKSMDGLWNRQQVIMNNIANYSTPGYKSMYVDFESELKNQVANLNPDIKAKPGIKQNIKGSEISMEVNDNLTMRQDGNNVDIEKENIEFARAQINYMYAMTELNSYIKKLNMVVWEGKK